MARPEGVHVVAGGNALRAEGALGAKLQQLVGARDVFRRSQFAIGFRPFNQGDIETVPFGNAGIVCELPARFLRRSAMGCEDRIEAETLRSLRAPQLLAGQRAGYAADIRAGQRVSHRKAWQSTSIN